MPKRLYVTLCSVFVEIDFCGVCDHFACRIVATRRAHMVWALQLTTVVTLVGVRRNE